MPREPLSPLLEGVSRNLRDARRTRGLTQRALGDRVGLPQSHVSKIEQGIVDLQLSSLAEMARALDLEIRLVPRPLLSAVDGVIQSLGKSGSPAQQPALMLDDEDG